MNEKREAAIRARASLATNYVVIFGLNLQTGICHDIDISDSFRQKIEEFDPRPERDSYEERMGIMATSVVHNDDLKSFLEGTSLSRVASELAAGSEYIVNYRVVSGNRIIFYRNKYVKNQLSGDDEVIVGIRAESDLLTGDRIPTLVRNDAYNAGGAERPRDLSVKNSAPDKADISPNSYAASINLPEDEAGRLLREKGLKVFNDFIYSLSHGIRTPMNAILGFSAMIEHYIDNREAVLEAASKIKVSGQNMLRLVNDILELSGIECGIVSNNRAVTDLNEFVQYTVEDMESAAELKGLSISCNVSGVTNSLVFVDSIHLKQILGNILDNSINFTNKGGRVNVLVDEEAGDKPEYSVYRFTIIDTGIGMRPEVIERYFNSDAYEYSNKSSLSQGVGIGVAITKRLVSLMGGHISVVSQQGVGTKVICSFELKHCTDENAIGSTKNSLYGRRVLLVEDNPLNREIARDILESEHMLAEEACDGAVAVDMVCNSEPGYYDFILMDIQMPYMDGYEAAREIRALEDRRLAEIPIVALTANAFEQDRRKAFEVGMNAHLSKPVGVNELMSLLRRFGTQK